MDRRPFAHLTEAVVTDHRTRRGMLRLAAGTGAGVASVVSAVAAFGKKKRKKKKCKKKPVTLQTDLVSCPGPALNGFSGGFRRFAQTFTAARTGVLTAAQVEVNALFEEGDFNLAIRAVDGDGVPTDDVLATVNVGEIAAIPSSTHLTLTVLFDPPASVVKDEQYAVVITETSQISYSISVQNSDMCAGQMFGDMNADGTFEPLQGAALIFAVSITSAT